MKKKTAWLLVLCMIASLFSIMTPYGTINAQAEETAESSTFVHPGILHTQKSIEAVKANIEAGDATTVAAYNALRGDGFSDPNWGGRPLENVVRGNTGDNRAQMYIDIERAYHTGLLYQLDAGDQYGDAAVRILNGWSHTMKSLSGNADRFLAAGIYGYQMANAAELVRDHKDFDKEAMDTLLLNIFYPMNKDFLENHNGAAISNYWANWDLCNIASMMAIGIFCDREDIYHEALSYYKNGEGMGSVFNTMPYVYATGDYGEELAQWQESGRDQGHATLGIGLCGAINEMAWSQGDDLYGMSDNRFLKAAEYVARYNNIADTENCDNLPFSSYTRKNSANGHYETGTGISGAGRPSGRPIYTAIYNHYVNRMGLEAPALKKILYPEDGSLVIEGGSRNGDQPGWQSLMFNNISTTEEGKNVKETVGPLEDGIYRFCNNLSKKTLVDNDGKLQCAKKGSTGTEWWNVKNTGDGEYVISNVKTGRVIQIDSDTYDSDSPAYVAGTVFTLGDSVTGEMNQRLAILKNKNDYVYRIANAIGSHVMELAGANTADDATICQWRYEGGAHQQWLAEEKETKGVIAYFNFDDKTEGFKGAGAAATVNGTVDIVEDQERGKVASFDHNAWLNVTKEDGTSLLSGNEELTISYYSKIDNPSANRGFYAAADTGTQVNGSEQYIGCLQQNKTITAERYSKATAGREPSASGTGSDGWNHIVIVYAKDAVKLYVNGTLTATADNTESLTEILGTDSILQIGKANLETDEYYQGLMDEFTVYNYALDESTIQNMDAHRLVAEFTFDDEIDGFATTAAKAVNAGTVELSDDTVSGSGKSLRLDGTGSNYLSVETFDGKPLASGFTEMTVSYWSKVENTKNNWMFYVAPDDEQQILNAEVYLGAVENNGSLKVERYKNSNKRIASIAEPAEQNVWKHVTVSFGKDITKVYINGEKQAELKSSYSVADILGENSVFYLGKANWGKQSEFSDALIDTVHIYNFALNDAQVAKDYAGYDAAIDNEDDTTDHSAEKTAAQKAIDLIQAIGTVEYTDACYKRITDARTAYDALTEEEKLWVTNADALFQAEKLYKELIPITPKCLATFTFDDETDGFSSQDAKAEGVGNVRLSENAVSGKALRLDGSNYVKLVDADGKSLLNGCKELTVSYWGKVYNTSANWGFYAAASDDTIVSGREKYLGVYDNGTLLKADRYYNAGTRPDSPQTAAGFCEWHYVTAVFGENSTSMYVDGTKVGEVNSEDKISKILGEDGVAYLGKANWGAGEYYDGLIDEVSVYNYALSEDEITDLYQKYTKPSYPVEKRVLAEFTFDDEENGFVSENGKAVTAGTNVLSEDAVSGKALSLDGTGSNYLKVTDKDGNALLDECEELSVSYWTKVSDTGTNWAYYASKDDEAQIYGQECYIAAVDKADSYEAVCWKNNGSRTENPTATVTEDKWRQITVVYGKISTSVYVNGVLKSEIKGNTALPDIVGNDGVFYIGRANWGSGEYFKGLIDEVRICNYALTQEEVTAFYKEKAPSAETEKKCLASFTFDDEESGFVSENGKAVAAGTNDLSDDAIKGKALSLDGTGSNYLKVTDTDGNALLSGCEELTVSYWRKVDNTGTNWAFFAAADDDAQTYLKEQYLGIIDSATKTEVQRWKNNGTRADAAKAELTQNTWQYVTYVFGAEDTKIYVNGKYQTGLNSSCAVENITGNHGVLYLGRANWGSGEFFNGLLDEVSIYNYAMTEDEIRLSYEKYEDPNKVGSCIARFSFDDEETGFGGNDAVAKTASTAELTEDAVAGKALKLDGTGTNYLTVTKENGDSLLTGLEELTISYWNKVDNDASNWVYYMAPDDAGQNYLTETYLGMLEKQGKLTAERYKNSGQRPGSATATVTGGAWNHVTVVYSADKTSIYVNGALSSEMGSGYKLSDILGENGIFYLGKANWGTGEYYNGLIDEVSIYDYALDAKDVEKIYQAPEAVKNVTELVNAIGIVDASAECKAKINAARAAYDGLFEIQKEMLTEDVSTTLTTAEAAYKKAVEEAGESGGGTTEPGGNESGGGNTETGGNESGGGNTETGGNENSGGNTGTGGGSTDTGSESTDAGSGMTNTGNSTTTTGTSDTEQAQKEQAQAKTTAVEETHKTITSANTDKGDVADSKFAALKVKAKEGNKSVKLSWSRVNGADGYIIYGAPCGKKMERIKELTASKKTYTVRKLLKGRYYKYMVVAYKNIYGEKRVIETSVSVHVATKGGKYGNPTAVTYGKSKVSVKTGKTFTLKAGLKTKTKVKTHIAKFRYESTDPSIATVNKKGKIKGIRKGTCTIYVYAQNGVYAKVTVKVKK